MSLPKIDTFFKRDVATDRTLKRKNSNSHSNLPLKRIKNTEQSNSSSDASSSSKILYDSSNKIEPHIYKRFEHLCQKEKINVEDFLDKQLKILENTPDSMNSYSSNLSTLDLNVDVVAFIDKQLEIIRNTSESDMSDSSNLSTLDLNVDVVAFIDKQLESIRNTSESDMSDSYNLSAFDLNVKPQNTIEPKVDEEPESIYSECDLEIQQILNLTNHPRFLSEFFNSGIYNFHQGTNRLVFINKITGQGYKIFKGSSNWKDGKDSLFYDMRINDIYRHQNFYGGRYAKFANNDVIRIIDDYNQPLFCRYVSLYTFKVIPNSKPLYWNRVQNECDKIPASALKMMEDIGYLPFDVKPQNFRKIKNERGGYDYLPTDAKLIGLKRSETPRTLDVINYKKEFGEYYYEAQYIDKDK